MSVLTTIVGTTDLTILVYFLYTTVGFPIAVVIAWALARIRMPFAYGLEFLFWVSFMLFTRSLMFIGQGVLSRWPRP